MKVITTVKEMQRYVRHNHRKGRRIALVPTMGYFHEGHILLMREARKRCDRVVISIFVNPLQFGRGEDFASYPRNMKRDLAVAQKEKANVVFAPTGEELYPGGYSTFVEEELLSKKLCGRFRPGHFKGVSTIVARLFNIVQPHVAVFGQKDAQQTAVIRKMIKDLNYPITLRVVPTAREKSGLACSSRNKYLNAREKKAAALIFKSLVTAEEAVKNGIVGSRALCKRVKETLGASPLIKVQYSELVDPETLASVSRVSGETLLAVAAHVGRARLIDNILLKA